MRKKLSSPEGQHEGDTKQLAEEGGEQPLYQPTAFRTAFYSLLHTFRLVQTTENSSLEVTNPIFFSLASIQGKQFEIDFCCYNYEILVVNLYDIKQDLNKKVATLIL